MSPFDNMFSIGNLRIHYLELDYPVDSSSLPADIQWISSVLEKILENTLSGL